MIIENVSQTLPAIFELTYQFAGDSTEKIDENYFSRRAAVHGLQFKKDIRSFYLWALSKSKSFFNPKNRFFGFVDTYKIMPACLAALSKKKPKGKKAKEKL